MPQGNNPGDFPTGTRPTGASSTGTAGTDRGTETGITHSSQTGAGTAPAADNQGLAAQAQQYGQKVADAAQQAKGYVADKMTVVGDKFKDLQNKDISQVAEEAKQYARQNPGQAILISAAAGLILGLLFRGSRR